MPLQEKERSYSQGGSGKHALESQGNFPLVYEFLSRLGIRTGIVRMIEAEADGHCTLRAWTGTEINVTNLSKELVLKAKGTGCLEIVGGGGEIQTEIYVQGGNIIRETKKSKDIDLRQGIMNI